MKAQLTASLALVVLIIGTSHAQPPSPTPETAAPTSGPGDGLLELIDELARTSGTEFVVDPRVRGNPVSVGSTTGISYDRLLAILRVQGYTAVRRNGRVHVVPIPIARQLATPIVQEDDPGISDDAIVTRVIELDTDTAPLVPILRPLLPQYAHLASDGNRALVIVDHYDNVRRISTLVEALGSLR